MTRSIFLAFVTTAALASADTLVLRNGATIEGSFVGGNSHSVRFAVGEQVNSYSIDDVEAIRFTNGAPAPAPAAQPQASNYPPPPNGAVAAPPPPPPGYPQPPDAPAPNASPQASNAPPLRSADTSAGPANNGPAGLEVPAGTQIVVRLIDPANSERDRLGQTYRASVDQPVLVNGQTLIPRGADATATLIDLQQSGKIEGKTVLTLDLKTVTVNGKNYDIVTTGIPEASKSRGARSAKTIGGGAVLGAIIGAAVGGGKGAAIGAGSGAAAGTAAEVMTSGQKVKIPAETRLTFTLQNPIDL